MTGAMVIVESGTPQQPFIAMLIQAMFLLLVLKVAPYNDDLDDWSSFVCSLALTFTTFAGFLLMIEANSTQQPVLSVGVLTAFLIAINAACFAYEIVVIMYVAYQDRLAKKAAKGIIIIAIKDNFQFGKNITVRRPIKVAESLTKFKKAVLTKLTIIPTSLVKRDINSPVCLLSMKCVSAEVSDLSISI